MEEFLVFFFNLLDSQGYARIRNFANSGFQAIMQSVNMEREEWQCGGTKVFIKSPESLFLLEEQRERKYNVHARVIQKAYKKYAARRKTNTEATEAAQLLAGRKERNRLSISRQFVGDYLGLDHDDQADISKHLGRRDRVLFACKVAKYNRKFLSARRDLIVTEMYIYIIGKRPVGSGDGKKKKKLPPNTPLESFVEEKIELQQLEKIALSPFQDGYALFHVQQRDKPILVHLEFKTEMVWAINKALRRKYNKSLPLAFEQNFVIKVEASGYFQRKGWKEVKPRHVQFRAARGGGRPVQEDKESVKYTMIVNVAPGAPAATMPSIRQQTKGGGQKRNQQSYQQSQHQNFPPPMGQSQRAAPKQQYPPALSVAPVQSYKQPVQQQQAPVPQWNAPQGKHPQANHHSIQNRNYSRHQILDSAVYNDSSNDSRKKQNSYIPPNQPANHFRLPPFQNNQNGTDKRVLSFNPAAAERQNFRYFCFINRTLRG